LRVVIIPPVAPAGEFGDSEDPMAAASAKGTVKVTVIPGDGIGPEVVAATRLVLAEAGVPITWEEREAGAAVFRRGLASGVPSETVESIARTRVVLKGPLETPVGFGEKSANVTLRKLFETYANVRPIREIPGVRTPFSGRGVDLVIVRENVEDLYAAVEHMQSPGVAQCLKLISRKGCEKVVRLAFELARAEGRKSVHCATKSNIMKLTEGLMKRTFEDVAAEYPDVAAHHVIVDNCAHQLVRRPEQFEVIVTTNMNGDILSDLGSGLIGGLGFAPGANLGSEVAIFEAVHGSAPKYAGQGVANPSAVLLSGVMMLRHLGFLAEAQRVEDAVYATLEAGCHTRDVAEAGALSTTRFAEEVARNLGRKPRALAARDVRRLQMPYTDPSPVAVVPTTRRVLGVDVFVECPLAPDELGPKVRTLAIGTGLALKMVSNRGTQVFPPTGAMTDVVDDYRCRFVAAHEGAEVSRAQVQLLLGRLGAELPWHHLELLQEFDGVAGYTRAQGED
jgi:isocitrate dehydrogenase